MHYYSKSAFEILAYLGKKLEFKIFLFFSTLHSFVPKCQLNIGNHIFTRQTLGNTMSNNISDPLPVISETNNLPSAPLITN